MQGRLLATRLGRKVLPPGNGRISRACRIARDERLMRHTPGGESCPARTLHNCLAQPRPVDDGTRADTASETILATAQAHGSATRITRNTVREEATKNHGSFTVRALDFRGHTTVSCRLAQSHWLLTRIV